MTKRITNIKDVVENYFESGSAHLRYNDRVSLESLLDEKVNLAMKSMLPDSNGQNRMKNNVARLIALFPTTGLRAPDQCLDLTKNTTNKYFHAILKGLIND